MTVARVNASFADREELERVAHLIRKVSPDTALMLDTKGHKIRVSDFGRDIAIQDGQKFSVFTEPVNNGIYLDTEQDIDLEMQVRPGSILLLDDGTIKIRVDEIRGQELVCTVLQGGMLRRRKTVIIQGVNIEFGGLSDKDKRDILTAKELEYDFIAASYIRNSRDVEDIRTLLGEYETGIIAKIEDKEGSENFKEILAAADGVMIARGDLSVSMEMEKVPVLQKKFIEECNELGKPVIVATQMLQSMVENVLPTRAEVNDVANAIFDGADAVMLSAETASGEHPVEAVEMMCKVASEIEEVVRPVRRSPTSMAKPSTNAIAQSVIDTCQTLPVEKIIVATNSGTTAKTIARFRPNQKIFAFTADVKSKRKLSLSRGILADVLDDATASSRDSGIKSLVRTALDRGYVNEKDLVVVIAGANILGTGGTNMLEINTVDQILS